LWRKEVTICNGSDEASEGGSPRTLRLYSRVRRRRSLLSFACITPSTSTSWEGCSLFQTTSTQELRVFCCFFVSCLRRACRDFSSSGKVLTFYWRLGQSNSGFYGCVLSWFFISKTSCLSSNTSSRSCLFSLSRESTFRNTFYVLLDTIIMPWKPSYNVTSMKILNALW
jgi:hypothetical protein